MLAEHTIEADGAATQGGIGQDVACAVLGILSNDRLDTRLPQLRSERFHKIVAGLIGTDIEEFFQVILAEPNVCFALRFSLFGVRPFLLEPGYLIVIGVGKITAPADKGR